MLIQKEEREWNKFNVDKNNFACLICDVSFKLNSFHEKI